MRGSIKLTWIWENKNYCLLIFYMSLEVQSPGANILVPQRYAESLQTNWLYH